MNMEPAGSQHYCLHWNNYQSNLIATFQQLLDEEHLVDVTLSASGRTLRAHRIILSACSPYFHNILSDTDANHPIVILQDVPFEDLQAIVQFMYRGEIYVAEEQLQSLLQVAESLKVRGLADVPIPNSDNSRHSSASMNGVSVSSPKGLGAGPHPEVYNGDATASISPVCSARSVIRGPPGLHPHPAANRPLHWQQEADARRGFDDGTKSDDSTKLMDAAPTLNGSHDTTYQHQLQQAWQKSWTQKQSLLQNLRFRERGSVKSWKPETMAGAIVSVLKEGNTLSQAARKYDIPYPTFVLYANRVHNLLGPSLEGPGCSPNEMRPKGRGRPQRILLGSWPDETVKNVIRAVVFRDASALKEQMEEHAALAAKQESGIPPPSAMAGCQAAGERIHYPPVAPSISLDSGRDGVNRHHPTKAPLPAQRGQMPNLLGFPDVRNVMMRMFPAGMPAQAPRIPNVNSLSLLSEPKLSPSRPVPPLSSISPLLPPSSSPSAEQDHVDTEPTGARRSSEQEPPYEPYRDGLNTKQQSRLEPIILPRTDCCSEQGDEAASGDAYHALIEHAKRARSNDSDRSEPVRPSREASSGASEQRSSPSPQLPNMPRLVPVVTGPMSTKISSPPPGTQPPSMMHPWRKTQGNAGVAAPALQAMP